MDAEKAWESKSKQSKKGKKRFFEDFSSGNFLGSQRGCGGKKNKGKRRKTWENRCLCEEKTETLNAKGILVAEWWWLMSLKTHYFLFSICSVYSGDSWLWTFVVITCFADHCNSPAIVYLLSIYILYFLFIIKNLSVFDK